LVVLVETVIVELAGAKDNPVTPETELVVAFVILPCASTVITGIAVVLPYEFATTPVDVNFADVTVLSVIDAIETDPFAKDEDTIFDNAIFYSFLLANQFIYQRF
jgi:hypothetical protein